METDKKVRLFHYVRIISFFVILFCGMVVGVIFEIRPKYSYIEKRDLEKLPSYRGEEAWNGKYFGKLSTWYSDTYPMRETLIQANASWNSMYGIHKEELTKSTQVADAIPTTSTIKDGDPNLIDDDPYLTDEELDLKSNDVDQKLPSADEASSDDIVTPKQDKDPDTGTTISSDNVGSSKKPEITDKKTNRKDKNTISNKELAESQTFGSIYVTKNRAFSLYYFNLKAANNYSKVINKYQKKLTGVTVYDILAPTSVGIYVDKKKSKEIGTSNQKEAFSYIYSNMNKAVRTVDAYGAIKEHSNEYLYYRTDHHWTALGAYYAYFQFCSEKNIKSNSLSSFEKKKYKNFLGSYYAASNQSSILKKNVDTIEAYIPMGTNKMEYTDKNGKVHVWPIVNDVSKYNMYSKYSAFTAGDNPYSVITNTNSKSKESCIVVKESYGNAMIPFLVDHYKNIYIIDYRYYKNGIVSLAKQKKVNDVIFINNAEAINNTVVSLLNNLAK